MFNVPEPRFDTNWQAHLQLGRTWIITGSQNQKNILEFAKVLVNVYESFAKHLERILQLLPLRNGNREVMTYLKNQITEWRKIFEPECIAAFRKAYYGIDMPNVEPFKAIDELAILFDKFDGFLEEYINNVTNRCFVLQNIIGIYKNMNLIKEFEPILNNTLHNIWQSVE